MSPIIEDPSLKDRKPTGFRLLPLGTASRLPLDRVCKASEDGRHHWVFELPTSCPKWATPHRKWICVDCGVGDNDPDLLVENGRKECEG